MALPSEMTAIEIAGGSGGADALRPVSAPLPVPKSGEILIRVHAAGVNRPDIVQRQGGYPPPPGASATLGLEVAGEVVIGAGRWRAGDRVCALLGGGGYAEFAAVDARHALPVPAGLDMIQAASLPETVFTVFANLFEHGSLKAGETLLVHAATSGIGVMAIQMGKAAGARVLATVRKADKVAAVLALGADLVIDTVAQDFGPAVKADGGADVILDMVGAPYLAGNLDALNSRGRLVYIASLGGSVISVPVFQLMRKQAVLTGSTLRARPADEKARLAAAIEATVWPWIAVGKIKPVIDRAFALEDAAQAHLFMEQPHLGKVVLTAI